MKHPHILLDGVSVHHTADPALDSVSLRFERGEHVALVGPSGSGKTTLLRLLNGLTRPSDGHVVLDGRDAESFSAQAMMSWRSRVGFVPQDHGLVPNVRVLRNVLAGRVGEAGFFRSLRDVLAPKREALMEIHELLERLGIGDLLYRRTDTLSGGEQQRLAIARALYQRPEALLADEPLASVDPARALDLLDLLQSVATERGLTLVVSLHNLDLARSHFPRLVGLRDGSVQFDGPPASLADDQIDDLYRLASSHEDS